MKRNFEFPRVVEGDSQDTSTEVFASIYIVQSLVCILYIQLMAGLFLVSPQPRWHLEEHRTDVGRG